MQQQFICYYRVSTKEQGDSRLGIEAQERSVRDYVGRVSGLIINTYTEVESGKNNKRPQLLKAIDESKRTGATLVIAKLDRLSRNARFIFLLRDTKVDFVCADMPSATSVTIGIMAVLAQDEAERTSQRTKDALSALKARGVKLGNPNIGSLSAKAHEARWGAVRDQDTPNRQALGLIIAKRLEKKTYEQIANELNEANYRTTYNKAFSKKTVEVLYLQAKNSFA